MGAVAVIQVVMAVYAYTRAQKAKREAERAADAQKGFQLTIEGEATALPVLYGRNKVGGVRVYHRTSDNYVYAPPAANATVLVTSTPSYTKTELVWVSDGFDGGYFQDELVSYPAQNNLGASVNGSNHEFLFVQQALSVGQLAGVYTAEVDGKPFNHEDLKYGQRIEVARSGGTPNPMLAANFAERANAKFTNCTFATMVFRINRDDPQYNNTPDVQLLVDGVPLRPIVVAPGDTLAISEDRILSNNPALVLLDYLTNDVYGCGLSTNEIDIPSFHAAMLICNRQVIAWKEVSGSFWQAQGVTARPIPLYECNLAVDTTAPLRDNVEKILSTMGDAVLVWADGRYKLQLQYPASTEEIVVAESLDADDLDMATVQITFPGATERKNFCTMSFMNEQEGFKSDSVSWPPRSGAVHQQFLLEDSGVALESSLSGDGITDPLHALAKCEETVRLSRSAVSFQFSFYHKNVVVESGDVLFVNAPEVGITNEFMQVMEVSLQEGGKYQVTCRRYSYEALAWNAADDSAGLTPSTESSALSPPRSIQYAASSALLGYSSGALSWLPPLNGAAASYVVYAASSNTVSAGNIVWDELGSSTTTSLQLQGLQTGSYVFGVVAVSRSGRRSERARSAVVAVTAPSIGIDTSAPPAPSGLSASPISGTRGISVSWDAPTFTNGGGLGTAIVKRAPWSSGNAVIADAAIVGMVNGTSFNDYPSGGAGSYAYWVSFKTQAGTVGGYAGGAHGVQGQVDETGTGAIPAGGIGTTQLADGSVTTPKLAAMAVTTAKIADGAITNAKIGANQVQSHHISDGAITPSEIQSGAVGATHLASMSVTEAKLGGGAVTNAKLGDGAVSPAKVASGYGLIRLITTGAAPTGDGANGLLAVSSSASVSSLYLFDVATQSWVQIPTTFTLADNSVTTVKLADGAVSTLKLADLAVTTAKVATGAITQAKIANGAVGSAQLATDAVTSQQLAASSVSGVKLQSGAVGATHIMDGAVTTAKLAAGSVGATQLASLAVTTAKIADANVTTAKLAFEIASGNMLPNGGMERFLASGLAADTSIAYSGYGTTTRVVTYSAVSSISPYGKFAQRIAVAELPADAVEAIYQYAPSAISGAHTLVLYLRGDGATRVRIGIQYTLDGTTWSFIASSYVTPSGASAKYSAAGTVPSGATGLRLHLSLNPTATVANAWVEADSITLVAGHTTHPVEVGYPLAGTSGGVLTATSSYSDTWLGNIVVLGSTQRLVQLPDGSPGDTIRILAKKTTWMLAGNVSMRLGTTMAGMLLPPSDDLVTLVWEADGSAPDNRWVVAGNWPMFEQLWPGPADDSCLYAFHHIEDMPAAGVVKVTGGGCNGASATAIGRCGAYAEALYTNCNSLQALVGSNQLSTATTGARDTRVYYASTSSAVIAPGGCNGNTVAITAASGVQVLRKAPTSTATTEAGLFGTATTPLGGVGGGAVGRYNGYGGAGYSSTYAKTGGPGAVVVPRYGAPERVLFSLGVGGVNGATTFVDAAGNATVTRVGNVTHSSAVTRRGINTVSLAGGYLALTPSSLMNISGYDTVRIVVDWRCTGNTVTLLDSATDTGGMDGFKIVFDADTELLRVYAREYVVCGFALTTAEQANVWHTVELSMLVYSTGALCLLRASGKSAFGIMSTTYGATSGLLGSDNLKIGQNTDNGAVVPSSDYLAGLAIYVR